MAEAKGTSGAELARIDRVLVRLAVSRDPGDRLWGRASTVGQRWEVLGPLNALSWTKGSVVKRLGREQLDTI
jgi:hypothetical protein